MDSRNDLTRQERRQIAINDLHTDLLDAGPTYAALLEASESELLRFLTEAEHVVTTSKDDVLLLADRNSLLIALGEAAADRLSINPTMGEAYLIVRKGKVCYQTGYKGLVRLAYRSGMIDSLHVDVVYSGERYQRSGGTMPGIEHTPDDSKRTGKLEDIVGAYAVVWLIGSSRPMFRAITKATIIEAAEASGDPRNKSYSSVWKQHAEAMAWKTALTRCSNQLPRTDKFSAFHLASQRAVLRDANVEPPELAGLEEIRALPPKASPDLDEGPRQLPAAPPSGARCNGKAAGLSASIRKRCEEYAAVVERTASAVYSGALAKLAIQKLPDGTEPTPEQLLVTDGKRVRALLEDAMARREPPEAVEREPGWDDDAEPPEDKTDPTAQKAP